MPPDGRAYWTETYVDRDRRVRLAPALLLIAGLLAAVPTTAVSANPEKSSAAVRTPTVSPEHPVSDPVTVPRGGDQSQPTVASNGNGHLVAWREGYGSGISGTRVSPSGEILDPAGIAISSGLDTSPSMPWNGTSYFVVWSRYSHTRTPVGVFGARARRAVTVTTTLGTRSDHESALVRARERVHVYGSFVVTAANGDQLYVSVDKVGDRPDASGDAHVAGPYVVTGGTGRLEGASGSGTTKTDANMFSPTATVVLMGTLSRT